MICFLTRQRFLVEWALSIMASDAFSLLLFAHDICQYKSARSRSRPMSRLDRLQSVIIPLPARGHHLHHVFSSAYPGARDIHKAAPLLLEVGLVRHVHHRPSGNCAPSGRKSRVTNCLIH
jgi:hypothetical protein